MPPGISSAIYDEYLESNMRPVLEGMVEALLAERPKHVADFCHAWLVKWHKNHDQNEEDRARLRAERDFWLGRRDQLSAQLKEGGAGGSSSSSARPSPSTGTAGRQVSIDPQSKSVDAEEAKEQALIRRSQSKGRRTGVSAAAISEERMQDWKAPVYQKSQEAREQLRLHIAGSEKMQVLFGHLLDHHLFVVIDAMFPKEVRTGETVITQGEEGDNFYIVEHGTFDVLVRRSQGEPDKVLEYGPGTCFGELALMYNAARAATVIATSDAKLWSLDRDSFHMMLSTAENTKSKQYEGFLASMDIFQDLTKYELAQLSDMLQQDAHDPGEPIISQGEEARYFYILEEGDAKAYISGEQGELEVKHYHEPGEYFGEIALLLEGTRKATVRGAVDGCTVLSVSKADLELVIGPIKDILLRNISKYPQYADFIRSEQDRAASKEKEDKRVSPRHADPIVGAENTKLSQREEFLSQIDMFRVLTTSALVKLSDLLTSELFDTDEEIVTQGKEGDTFFIIEDGECKAYIDGEMGEVEVKHYKEPGEFFGEVALMTKSTRKATVRAVGTGCSVLTLRSEDFQNILGPIKDLMQETIDKYPTYADIARAAKD
mmetsp:Transcript_52325/g.94168  ORF Transcript_52325/g.94168 Transcript_52325/m.94168 type:complete len:603 (-) Transcript_52325:62-1870(-)